MITITDDENLTLKKGIKYLYFYSPNIIFNKKMTEMILKMEKEFNIIFEAIDIYNFKKYVDIFSLKQAPTILILNDGKIKLKIEGLPLTKSFRSNIRNFLNIKEETE